MPSNKNMLVSVTLILLFTVGLWLRIYNLGALSFVVDEGIQALAIKANLEYGIPKMNSGAIYTRNLVSQLLQTLLAGWQSLTPFWLRLPSAFFGALIVFPAYWLGKMLFSPRVGILTAFILTFSIWEIEFSRYARPYAILQFFYVLVIGCFFRGFFLKEQKYRFLFLACLAILLFTHNLSIIAITLFVIPFLNSDFKRSEKGEIIIWATISGFLMLGYRWVVSSLKKMNEIPVLPDQAVIQSMNSLDRLRSLFGVPNIYIPDTSFFLGAWDEHRIWVFTLIFLALGSFAIIFRQLHKASSKGPLVLAFVMLAALFFYQIGFFILCLAVYIVLYGSSWQSLFEQHLKVVYAFGAIASLFWIQVIVQSSLFTTKSILEALIGFPHFTKYFLYWFVVGWPVLLLVVLAASVYFLKQFLKDRTRKLELFVLGSLYVPALAASFVSAYPAARYTFHLYPLMVIIFSWAVFYLLDKLCDRLRVHSGLSYYMLSVLFVLAAFFSTWDANPVKLFEISNRSYRSTHDPIRDTVNWNQYAYFHQDHKSPAEYLKKHITENDSVLALGALHMIALYYYYGGQVDFALSPLSDPSYYSFQGPESRQNYITGSQLISGISSIEQIIERTPGNLWILGDYVLLREDNEFYSSEVKAYLSKLAEFPVYVGHDDMTFLLKL